jgi:hypothetical protein
MTTLAYLAAAYPVTHGGAVALAAIAFDALFCLFFVCTDFVDARRHRARLARAGDKEGA